MLYSFALLLRCGLFVAKCARVFANRRLRAMRRIDSARPLPQPKTMADILDTLEQTIRERRESDPDSSYVARLAHKGRAKIAQKVGEEAVETVIAAITDDKAGMTSEAADLMFHLLVLLADAGLSLDDVRAELARREGVSGLDEKASRNAH